MDGIATVIWFSSVERARLELRGGDVGRCGGMRGQPRQRSHLLMGENEHGGKSERDLCVRTYWCGMFGRKALKIDISTKKYTRMQLNR